MTLTHEDLTVLKKPFAANDHKFLRGLAYITEYAITERMDEVDPSWSFNIQEIVNRDGTITVIGNLTIKGVTRSNVGMDSVRETKDGNSEANEAEKSTATDALKRCARLFGIGRYLLTLPKDVKDEQSMARWLNSQKPAHAPRPQPQVQVQPKAQVQPTVTEEASWDENTWKRHAFTVSKFLYTDLDGKYVEQRHSASMKKRMEDTGDYGINPSMTLYEVLSRLIRYRALTDLFIDSSDYQKVFGMPFADFYDKNGAEATWTRFMDYYIANTQPAKTKQAS